MTIDTLRSKRLRKKLFMGEFAIKGFELSCKIQPEPAGEYERFFDHFSVLLDTRNLYIELDDAQDLFGGFVSSMDRYGSVSNDDRAAVQEALISATIVSDIEISPLIDAFYES